ncbi:MAG: MoxR family ATPase [Burkholderiaceae bacterium]|nr:MoxR family ATPase [Burkholderiaceae bacterium]
MTEQSIAQQAFGSLKQLISQQIIGQEVLVDRLLIALLADGHLLVEGAPGLAKTRAIKVLSEGIEGDFHRVQFTPDLLPADLTGTDIFRPQDGSFKFQPGPLFHNLILADEVNRAPAKVQSALLEAMAERQITVGTTTYPLPDIFLVMATQNPIEQEGTYPLPEAQLDRFLLHVKIDYPDADAEMKILQLVRGEAAQTTRSVVPAAAKLSNQSLHAARQEVLGIFMADNLERYLVEIVLATRDPARYDAKLAKWVQWGASPRATIALDRCARAHAWLAGRDYVGPEDIQAIAFDVLRHRVLLTYEAEAEGHSSDHFIAALLQLIPVP